MKVKTELEQLREKNVFLYNLGNAVQSEKNIISRKLDKAVNSFWPRVDRINGLKYEFKHKEEIINLISEYQDIIEEKINLITKTPVASYMSDVHQMD
jgi:hypothetical protein